MDNVISVRLSDEQMQMLEYLVESTGWTYSQVFRQLLDSATVRPAVIQTRVLPKGKPLAALEATE